MRIPPNITRYSDRITYIDRIRAEKEQGAQRARQAAKRAEVQPQLDDLGDAALAAVNDSQALAEIGRQIDALLETVRNA